MTYPGRAEMEDLRVGERDVWTASSSSSSPSPSSAAGSSHPMMMMFDLSSTTVRPLTPSAGAHGHKGPRYSDADEGDAIADAVYYELGNRAVYLGGNYEYAAAAAANSDSQKALRRSGGTGHSATGDHVSLDGHVHFRSTAVVEDLSQNMRSEGEAVQLVLVKAGDAKDYGGLENSEEDGSCSDRHMPSYGRADDSAFPAVSRDGVQNTHSSNGVVVSVDFQAEAGGSYRECEELQDDKVPAVGSVSACKAAAESRCVRCLYVVLAAEQTRCRPSSCFVEDETFEVDVSN